jgi:hypothetical protein
MTYDFSQFYNRETVSVVDGDGKEIFTATVRELTHGEKTAIQMNLATKVDIPTEGSKKSRQKQYQQGIKSVVKNGGITDSALLEEISCIESWTLTLKGESVPVCMEAWVSMPSAWAQQIGEAIERLNPELDDEFQD